jgi:hypothetical protein
MSNKGPVYGDREWECGWEEHQKMQLRRLSLLPLADKLAWLEEAHRIVRHLESERLRHSSRNPS